MKYFTVDLRKEFPELTNGNPTLDCFIADPLLEHKDRLRPAVLVIPGGGYAVVCADREGDPMAFSFLKEGYCAFVLNYTVGERCFPSAFLEAAAAMLYIRKHAAEFCINPSQIAALGGSAGGHLAASLGTLCFDGEVEQTFGVDPSLAVPNALVLNYPVISSDPSISHRDSFINLTGTDDATTPLYQKLSLDKRVNEKTPPVYIWHTSDDACVPVQNSILFALALAQHGIKYELHIFPTGPHGLATANFAAYNYVLDSETAKSRHWLTEACQFLNTLWFGVRTAE